MNNFYIKNQSRVMTNVVVSVILLTLQLLRLPLVFVAAGAAAVVAAAAAATTTAAAAG